MGESSPNLASKALSDKMFKYGDFFFEEANLTNWEIDKLRFIPSKVSFYNLLIQMLRERVFFRAYRKSYD